MTKKYDDKFPRATYNDSFGEYPATRNTEYEKYRTTDKSTHNSYVGAFCEHKPKGIKCGDTTIYVSGRRFLKYETDLPQYEFLVPLGAEFQLTTFIGYTGFLLPFPIKDFDKPNPDHLRLMAERMLVFARAGSKVLTFCEGSHGRTGLMMATCIGLAEPECEDPVEAIRQRHCKKACETAEQIRAVFQALGRPLPEKYAKANLGSKQFAVFTAPQLTAFKDLTKTNLTLPALPPPLMPMVPQSDVVVVPTYATLNRLQEEYDAAIELVGELNDDDPPELELPPEPRAIFTAQPAKGGDIDLDPFDLGVVAGWKKAQQSRLLIPLLQAKVVSWIHITKGLQCAVCMKFEKDPTRMTLSAVTMANDAETSPKIMPHHLDCDEYAAKSAPVLTGVQRLWLAANAPKLWAVYRDKRKHRRKRRKRSLSN